MSIHALSQKAVRAIGASQVLTDPASVIKELIDNALDARATSVFVELSVNTLDIIQVRDNGHGIAPEDRPLVAKRYCTSKMKNEQDLASIGGTSLGFRGEALSSAAEMSGSMTITTRVEGETIAYGLKIAQNGELTGQDKASHPVGTTVRITDYLKAHPVRRQVALKDAAKCVAKVKQMLQAYAFARPATRLQLKVLKAKNEKGNWAYAPKPNANIEDAALKIVGNACASQCVWCVLEHDGFTAQAFLPKSDADASKIGNIGQFLSIDGRPMSVARGTPKQVVKLFKEALKRSNSAFDGVRDPFLYLCLICPSETYDPNVEPAKDDVLFEDSARVLDAIRRLFDTVYPIKSINDALISQRSTMRGPTEDAELEAEEIERPASKRRRTFRPNMYGCDEEDLDLFVPQSPEARAEEEEELHAAARDVSISNPWVTAKLNSSVRKQHLPFDNAQLLTPAGREDGLQVLTSSPVRENPSRQPQQSHALLTPRASSPFTQITSRDGSAGDNRVIGANRLPPPELYMTPDMATSPVRQPENDVFGGRDFTHDFDTSGPSPEPSSSLNIGIPLSSIPDAPARRRSPRKPQQQSSLNKPFISPVHDERDAWFNIPDMHRSQPGRRTHPRTQQSPSQNLIPRGEVDENQPLSPPKRNRDIRNYLGSAQTATNAVPRASLSAMDTRDENTAPSPERSRSYLPGIRDFVRASELDPDGPAEPEPPRKAARAGRRRTSEARALLQVSGNRSAAADPNEEVGTDGAQRQPSRRRRTSEGAARAQRTKSLRLPLERVPPYAQMQNVVFHLPLTTFAIGRMQQNIESRGTFVGWNQPALDAFDTFAFEITNADIDNWTERLGAVLGKWYPEGDMVGNLGDGVKAAFQGQDVPISSAVSAT